MKGSEIENVFGQYDGGRIHIWRCTDGFAFCFLSAGVAERKDSVWAIFHRLLKGSQYECWERKLWKCANRSHV